MPKHRMMRIVLFPVFAPIFLLGFLLSFISASKARKAQKCITVATRETHASKKDHLEIGLIQELAEEPIANA